jgi:hypothetical protein
MSVMHGIITVHILDASTQNHDEGHLRLANFYFNRNILFLIPEQNRGNPSLVGSSERKKGNVDHDRIIKQKGKNNHADHA